jgi:hypothetical protein
MTRRLLLAVLLLCACHKKRATKELFGVKVTPPGVLAKIRPGMPLAELKALVPDMKNDPGKGYELEHPASNVTLYAVVMNDVVSDTYIDLIDDHGIDLLTSAWGPPDAEKPRDSIKDVAWRSTATGWRASVFCGHGTEVTPLPPFCTITLHPHKPLEEMFGKTIAPVGEYATVKQDTPVAQTKASTIRDLDYDGAVEFVDILDGKLFSIHYTLPVLARPMIVKAWGPGTADPGHADSTTWCDAATSWCATLDSASDKDKLRLEFVGFMPFEQQIDLLEALSKLSIADGMKAHPELQWAERKDGTSTDHYINLPISELTDAGMRMVKHLPAGGFELKKGTRYVMTMFEKTTEDAIVASFTKRWGPPKKSIDKLFKEVTRYEWPNGNSVTVDEGSLAFAIDPS